MRPELLRFFAGPRSLHHQDRRSNSDGFSCRDFTSLLGHKPRVADARTVGAPKVLQQELDTDMETGVLARGHGVDELHVRFAASSDGHFASAPQRDLSED